MRERLLQSGRASSNVIALIGIGVLLLFALGTHSCLFRGFGVDMMGNPLFRGWSFSPYSLLGLGGLLQIGLAAWVGYDAHRRGMNGFLWGLLVLFTFIVGLIVYLLVGGAMSRGQASPFAADWAARVAPPDVPRQDTARATGGQTAAAEPAAGTADTCPHCDEPVQPDFKVCPFCAGALLCGGCDSPLEAGWKVCPRCARPVA